MTTTENEQKTELKLPKFEYFTTRELAHADQQFFQCSFGKVRQSVIPPGRIRDVLKTVRRLATPSVELSVSIAGNMHKKVGLLTETAESEAYVPLKPRDLPMYNPIYLEEKDLDKLHSGQYEYIVHTIPENASRFMLLCTKFEGQPLSVLIDKWKGSLRVILIALDRYPQRWFMGSLFHGFLKEGRFRIHNIAAYNDRSCSHENSMYRILHIMKQAYLDYQSCPVLFVDDVDSTLKIDLAPCVEYRGMKELCKISESHWQPRAYWFVPGADQLEIEVESEKDAKADTESKTKTSLEKITKILLTGTHPLFFEVPFHATYYHTFLSFMIEPSIDIMKGIETDLPILRATMAEMHGLDKKYHLKLYCRAPTHEAISGTSTILSKDMGKAVGAIYVLPQSSSIINHLMSKWCDQQTIYKYFCLDTDATLPDSTKILEQFQQMARENKFSGVCSVFLDPSSLDKKQNVWKVGPYCPTELEGTSFEEMQRLFVAAQRGKLIDATKLAAIQENIQKTSRTEADDEELLKLAGDCKEYILRMTGWLQS